jgi:hypothetical protein
MSRPSLTESLLRKYFTTVSVLRDYLPTVLVSAGIDDGEAFNVTQEGDSRAYIDLINTTYVAFTQFDATAHKSRFQVYPAEIYMSQVRIRAMEPRPRVLNQRHQVIDKAQELLLRRVKGRCHNVITFGYRLVSVVVLMSNRERSQVV